MDEALVWLQSEPHKWIAIGVVLLVFAVITLAFDWLRRKVSGWLALVWFVLLLAALWIHPVKARDDGRYASSPLKGWFDQLKSKSGDLCCSDADGTAISDAEWDAKNGHYRVFLEGEWRDVPDSAVITEPNRAGKTMVWPLRGYMGLTIRCFMPGSMM